MYKVNLSACGNIDYGENPYSNIVDGRRVPHVIAEVESIDDCIEMAILYIAKYNLGGGNWNGGEVFKDNRYIGRISPNGRFWDENTEYGR